MKCPACQAELVHCNNEYGNFWHCGDCAGTAVTLPLLKRFVDRETIQALWRGVKDWNHVARRCCPGCNNRMEEVPLQLSAGPVMIDVCEVCQFVWMDAGEWDVLPNAPADRDEAALSPAARQQLAIAQTEQIRARYEASRQNYELTDFISDCIASGVDGAVGQVIESLIEGIFETFS